jgi:hypothetical protein
MVGCSDRARDRGLLLVVGKSLSSEVGGSALRNLDNDGGFNVPLANPRQSFTRIKLLSKEIPCSFEDSVGGRRRGYILYCHVKKRLEVTVDKLTMA